MYKKNLLFLSVFVITALFFFNPFILKGKLPIPSDTIIGLYHPFRDLYAKEYPNGIPFKNFLITDPVRQQYPWRKLSIDIEKKLQLPIWNPYSMTGTPLLGNFQAAVFYPLNVFLFVLPYNLGWSSLVVLQVLLAGIFMYFYLEYLKLNKWASLLGSLCFAFSGFSVAWLEWNTIVHTALWLPLLLLSQEHLLKKRSVKWISVFLIAQCSAFFAGHLQTYFYLFLISNLYLFARILHISLKDKKLKVVLDTGIRLYMPFLLLGALVFLVIAVQLIPTLQFILSSARGVDQANWHIEGWFIPWQHLVQFVAPDFFGNPTTLNYWGVWNYAEFIGYIGVIPLIFALFAVFSRRDKKTLFFGSIFFCSLLFSFPTIIAQIPYMLHIPFLSTSQPTRLLFVSDFSLAVLATLGFDLFIRERRKIVYPIGFIALIFGLLWVFVLFGSNIISGVQPENLLVAKSNLMFPTGILILSIFFLVVGAYVKNKQIKQGALVLIILVTIVDLLRFGNKFTPFTEQKYLFPETKTILFLQSATSRDQSRIMSLDSRILPPNFSNVYKLQSIEGYDPLYIKRYGELIAASERNKPDIAPPFGFNRIITPHRFNSRIVDLMGVKYVLTLDEIKEQKLKKVFEEGQTKVYENVNAFPRAFFVENIIYAQNSNDAIKKMFNEGIDLEKTAILESTEEIEENFSIGEVSIEEYSPNKIVLRTKNKNNGFLVLTDAYYSGWRAQIDGVATGIYRTDFNFRGIQVSKGEHVVLFYPTIF